MPLIGFCPWLCMFSLFVPCCERIASDKPMCQKVEWMGSSWMSSLILASIITVSPSFCHVSTCAFRSLSIWWCGHACSLASKPPYLLLVCSKVSIWFAGTVDQNHSKSGSLCPWVEPNTSNLSPLDHLLVLLFYVTIYLKPEQLCLPVGSLPHVNLVCYVICSICLLPTILWFLLVIIHWNGGSPMPCLVLLGPWYQFHFLPRNLIVNPISCPSMVYLGYHQHFVVPVW